MTIGAMLVAFGIGGIPFGWLLARWHGVDVRRDGSGNIGATNVARLTHVGLGVCTLLLDALKGWAMAAAGAWVDGERLAAGMGCAAILGHTFSPYLGFRGGKGVATAAGVFVWLSPVALAGAVTAFLAVSLMTRVIAMGSMAAAMALPVGVWGGSDPGEYPPKLSVFIGMLVLVRHSSNLGQMFSRYATGDRAGFRPGAGDPKPPAHGDIRPDIRRPPIQSVTKETRR